MGLSLSHKKRVLMVSGFHDECKYIPMGTFGLCDFLSQRGIESKIFNASIYNIHNYLAKLKTVINEYKPDYIGLIIHWKESLENCVFLSYEIKKWSPHTKIVTGGLTAGFLGKDLLRRFGSIDFVIKGDPEKPLHMLITEDAVTNIPNLIYRHNNRIIKNKSVYAIEKKTLNSISYAGLYYLIDNKKYIEKINTVLGFPIFIGRGCIHDCLFCGGSKRAFRIHSNRENVVCRDIQCVIRDLKLLLEYTDTIYICYEVSANYIYNLFTAVLAEKKISKKLKLNYGAWKLIDPKMLDLYSRAFKFDTKKRSVIEISPETSVDKDRGIIKGKSLYFSKKQMLQSIKLIQQKLGNVVTVSLFYSRYHKTQNNSKKLMSELKNIHELREGFYASGENNVTVEYTPLATDVGSVYWDLAVKNLRRPDKIDLLLNIIKKQKLTCSNDFIMENLCIYSPKKLSVNTIFRYEKLIALIDLMLREVPGYYFHITKVLGFSKFTELLEELIDNHSRSKKYFSLQNMNTDYLIDFLHGKIKTLYRYLYCENPGFFNDLLTIYLKYLNAQYIKLDGRYECFIKKPILDPSKFYVSNYDFFCNQFYLSLDNGISNVLRRKTLNVFCSNQIYSFEYKYYKLFKLFNGKNTVNDVLVGMTRYNFTSEDEFVKLYSLISSRSYFFTS